MYRITLGDIHTADFVGERALLMWVLFLLCTLFNMIVMLNLLIAIISDTFSQVNAAAATAAYQERATLISENHYLIPIVEKEKYAQRNTFILVVTDLENASTDIVDPVHVQMADLGQ